MRSLALLFLAGALLESGCQSVRTPVAAKPPFELTDCAGAGRNLPLNFDPALPGYRLPIGDSYGTIWLKPTAGQRPERIVLVFPGRFPPYGVQISNADEQLFIGGDSAVLAKSPGRGSATISRNAVGTHVDIQSHPGETRVVLLPMAMHLVTKPFSIHWGIPK
jgi:hypothetical protein